MTMKSVLLAASALAIGAALAGAAQARDQIQIAGSSTVLPYATIVAEAFGENFDFATPVVEGGGSGAGRKKLCEGVGENTIDIANSSSAGSSSRTSTSATPERRRPRSWRSASAMTASSLPAT
jgi:phosphate transport system substrate-binding protein